MDSYVTYSLLVILWIALGLLGSARFMASQVRTYASIAVEIYTSQRNLFWIYALYGPINLVITEIVINSMRQVQDNGLMIPGKKARKEAECLRRNFRESLYREIARLRVER